MTNKTNDLFQAVKQQVSIIDAAEFYGISVYKGTAVCPFHQDTHPSLKFKEPFFKCFVCDAKGDVITLVAKLFQCTPIQAALKINKDYHLGFSASGFIPYEAAKLKQRKNIVKAFSNWEIESYLLLKSAYQYLMEVIQTKAPKQIDTTPSQEWLSALSRLSRLEYLLDLLICGTEIEKIQLFQNCRKEVEEFGGIGKTNQYS